MLWHGCMRAGEMVFPWMFEDFAALAPLRGAAEALAKKADWPPLYDLAALQSTTAPVASATYYDDMYVDMDCAQVTPSPTHPDSHGVQSLPRRHNALAYGHLSTHCFQRLTFSVCTVHSARIVASRSTLRRD